MTLDFHTNKKILEEVAIIPSKRLRNKIAGFSVRRGEAGGRSGHQLHAAGRRLGHHGLGPLRHHRLATALHQVPQIAFAFLALGWDPGILVRRQVVEQRRDQGGQGGALLVHRQGFRHQHLAFSGQILLQAAQHDGLAAHQRAARIGAGVRMAYVDIVTRFSHDAARWMLGHPHATVALDCLDQPRADLNDVLKLTLPVTAAPAPVDPQWGARIVAVTTHDITLSSLQERLDGRVEREALPRDLRRVDSLPMTSSGKVDRLAIASSWIG